MSPPLAAAPQAVAAAIDRLKEELAGAAGKNLAALILYGGLARGRYRPGKSDVNVVVLLHEASAQALAAVAPALRAARRSAGVEPMLLTPGELPAAAAAFPTKFLDIQAYHIVLLGESPFAALDVPRAAIRMRVAQQLRNLSLRLRRRYLAVVSDPDAQATALAQVARPLALEAAALLRLAGKPLPAEDRTAAILSATATAFDLDRDALARLADLRQQERTSADISVLFGKILAIVARLADTAAELK